MDGSPSSNSLIVGEGALFLSRNYKKWLNIILALVFQVLVLVLPVNSQTVVNVFDTTAFGSPDPSGLTFLPGSSALLLSDSEVDENPFLGDDNIFQLGLSGNLLLTQSTLGFSREPTGVAFNTATGTLFISDDDQRMVFEVDPVTLEVLSSFSTIDSGCWDAEDIAFDPATGNLFIAGGASKLICEVTFDGIFVSSFNVPEINDPEGIAFDSVSGNLFITSSNHIFEVTRGGVLVRVIDILRPFGVTVLKAITFAPSSDPDDDPTILNLYVADYGADGVSDGRIYEISLVELPEQQRPDLAETFVSNPPESATHGGSFTVTDTVLNQGTAPAGTSTTRYYLSLDTLRNSGDKQLTGSRAVPGLAPGEASTGTVSVTIPSTTLAGIYFLLACADDMKVVPESNENNNCRASQTQVEVKTPDLVETAVSNPPESATAGGSLTVTDTVLNQGNAPAGTSTTRYYLSLDTLLNSGDKRLTGSRAVPGLAPGEASTGTVTVTIPSTTLPGTYFLLACADDKKVVAESNEKNNCLASATQVTVGNQ